MAPKLLVLAACVLLVSCLEGRRDAPAVHCTDPARSDCIALAAGTLRGPGTYRIPGSRYVFDVPARSWVRVSSPRSGVPEVTPAGASGTRIPLFARRVPAQKPGGLELTTESLAGAWSAGLHVGAHSGDELFRYIMAADSTEVIYGYPTLRVVYDHATSETTDRFPLDRVSILPDVDVLFARTAADLLFDRIAGSIRIPD